MKAKIRESMDALWVKLASEPKRPDAMIVSGDAYEAYLGLANQTASE